MGKEELIPVVQGTDGEEPDTYVMSRIRETGCMNCQKAFNNVELILFVITRNGILWWHRARNCSRDR